MAKVKPIKSWELQLCNTHDAIAAYEDHYEVKQTVSCLCGMWRLWSVSCGAPVVGRPIFFFFFHPNPQATSVMPKSSVLFVSTGYRSPKVIWYLTIVTLVGIVVAAAMGTGLEVIWAWPCISFVALVIYMIISDRVVNFNIFMKHAMAPLGGARSFTVQLGKEDATEALEVFSADQLLLIKQQPSWPGGYEFSVRDPTPGQASNLPLPSPPV